MQVDPMDIDGDVFSFRTRVGGRTFSVPMKTLDEASQQAIRTWEKLGTHLSTDYEIEVNTGRSRDFGDTYNYDNSAVNLEPEIMVKNPNMNKKTRGGRVAVMFLGRSVVSRDAIYVFCKEVCDLPVLEGDKTLVIKMKKQRWEYDDNYPSVFGARYIGYVVIIEDPKTREVFHVKSIPSLFEKKDTKKMLLWSSGFYYDDGTLAPSNALTER